MSFCYVIMCHTDPEGVLRLVTRIRTLSPDAEILVRFDREGLVDVRRVEDVGAHVHVSRIRVTWGDATFASAVVEALTVARAVTGCDYAVVLSGQDVPIRPLSEWERMIAGLGVDAVLSPLADQPQDHTWRWSVVTPPPGLRGDRSPMRRAMVRAGSVASERFTVLTRPGEPRLWVGVRGRRADSPVHPVKCATWAVYHARAIASIRRQDQGRPGLRSFFRHVRTPDEWYAPSLVCDDPNLRIAIGEVSATSFLPGSPSPMWLDLDVLEHLRRSSSAPFARKVAPDVAPAVLAEADRLAGRSPEQVRADVVEPGARVIPWRHSIRAQVLGATVEAGRE